MSKLQELIQKLCPNGVVYKTIQEIVGVNRGKRLIKSQLSEDGQYEVYHGSKDSILGKYNKYNAPANTTIVVNTGGIGGVKFLDKPFWCSDGSFWLGQSDEVHSKFLYYCLSGCEDYFYSQKRVGGVPTIDRSVVEKFEIPVPPLEVQEEIVKILDRFAEYAAELQAELQARQEQYEYYRDKLLSFNNIDGGGYASVTWMKMSEICEIGTGSSNTQDELSVGLYPFFVRSQTVRRKNEYEFDETAIITSGDGVGVGKIFHYVEGKYALHQRAYRLHVTHENLIPKFLFHYMRCNFYNYITQNAYTSSVTSIRKPMLLNFPIPIPSLEAQRHIINILDKFEALTSDLSQGLPAEIAAIQEQYEYYRNKLLTFNKISA